MKFENIAETELCDFTSPDKNICRILGNEVEEESQESDGTSRRISAMGFFRILESIIDFKLSDEVMKISLQLISTISTMAVSILQLSAAVGIRPTFSLSLQD